MESPPRSSLAGTALAVVSVLSFVTACGDVDTFKIRTSSSGETEALEDLEGRFVQLIRATTPCDSGEPDALFALVGGHMEFPGEDVATLKSACSDGNEARVSIDIEARSVIYDFSNVTGSGSFASAAFDGYVFQDLAQSNRKISSATIDREVSNLDMDDDDLVVGAHTLRANFAGLPFDETTFVKIDLTFD